MTFNWGVAPPVPKAGLGGEPGSGIPLDTVDKMKAALASGSPAAKKSEFVVYPDTPHAFHADYRPSYNKAVLRAVHEAITIADQFILSRTLLLEKAGVDAPP